MQSVSLSFQGVRFGGLGGRVGALSHCRLVHIGVRSFRAWEIPEFIREGNGGIVLSGAGRSTGGEAHDFVRLTRRWKRRSSTVAPAFSSAHTPMNTFAQACSSARRLANTFTRALSSSCALVTVVSFIA